MSTAIHGIRSDDACLRVPAFADHDQKGEDETGDDPDRQPEDRADEEP